MAVPLYVFGTLLGLIVGVGVFIFQSREQQNQYNRPQLQNEKRPPRPNNQTQRKSEQPNINSGNQKKDENNPTQSENTEINNTIENVESKECSKCKQAIGSTKFLGFDCGHIFHLKCFGNFETKTCPFCLALKIQKK